MEYALINNEDGSISEIIHSKKGIIQVGVMWLASGINIDKITIHSKMDESWYYWKSYKDFIAKSDYREVPVPPEDREDRSTNMQVQIFETPDYKGDATQLANAVNDFLSTLEMDGYEFVEKTVNTVRNNSHNHAIIITIWYKSRVEYKRETE